MNAALREIGWNAERISTLFERVGELAEDVPQDPADAWTIEHVATLPTFRRQGLAAELLERAISRGAELGGAVAVVDVFTGNSQARSIYKRAGFTSECIFGERALRRILGRDPLERMMRVL